MTSFVSVPRPDDDVLVGAVRPRPEISLDEAAVAKLDETLRVSSSSPPMTICWKSAPAGAAWRYTRRTNYGCRVTTTTISREQYEYTAVAGQGELGLTDRITVLCEDYRALTGQYDKLVSVEMIEAVGHHFYRSYFQCCSKLLKPERQDGDPGDHHRRPALRGVLDAVRRLHQALHLPRRLPAVARRDQRSMWPTDTDMQMVHLRDITPDYALTLAHWRRRFMDRLDEVRAMGFDDRFIRMWEFYLSYCEGGFRERIIGTVQLAFAKPGYRPAP
jgi:cyclopropane-fatty-acyl-phospholipid synthase